MKRVFALMIAALALLPVAAAPAQAASFKGNCPPGLAKKNPPCIPPGQAKKLATPYHVGGYLPRGDYDRIRDYGRYQLPRLRSGEVYYRVGDSVLRVDRETREILQLIESLARVVN